MKTIYTLLFSLIFLTFLVGFSTPVEALSPSDGRGVYTNLCGTGYDASGYGCPAACDTNSGSCSGAAVAKFVCNGRQTECRSNESWSTYQTISGSDCDKTVQIDVFSKNCRDANGNWTCQGTNPVADPNSDLKGYIVWYSGACAVPTAVPTVIPTNIPTPTPTTIVPVPTIPQGGNTVSCPSGFVETITGSNIICVQQNQTQTQTVTSTSNATTGPINITNSVPQVIEGKTPVITTELPKTGLPLAAWALSGLAPLGLRLKKFGASSKALQDSASYLWQQRQFSKD